MKKTNPQFRLIRAWAEERGIYTKGDPLTQFAKLSEEQGELARALIKDNPEEAMDAIGDMVVVLTNLAELLHRKYYFTDGSPHISIESCINKAWEEIKDRQGSMKNGTFVKANV